jgi:hypothetical protein
MEMHSSSKPPPELENEAARLAAKKDHPLKEATENHLDSNKKKSLRPKANGKV